MNKIRFRKAYVYAISIIALIIIVLFIPINSKDILILKGNILFGKSSTCNKIEIMTDDITNRKCILCNKIFRGSSSEIICYKCCDITNRCCACGKIKEEITEFY